MPEDTNTPGENARNWWLAYPGVVATGTISTLAASGLIYLGTLLIDPKNNVELLVSEEDRVEFAIEIISDNRDQISNHQEEFRDIGLLFESEIFEEAAKKAKDTDGGWDDLKRTLTSAGLMPSTMVQLLEVLFDWSRMPIAETSEMVLALPRAPSPPKPFSDETSEEFSKGVGGHSPLPVVTVLEGTDGPSGNIVVPELGIFGYRYAGQHPLPTVIGKATRMLFSNDSNNRSLDVIIAKYDEQLDPRNLPLGYNSGNYEYFIRQSGDYIFVGIGKEVPAFLEQVIWSTISANTVRGPTSQ